MKCQTNMIGMSVIITIIMIMITFRRYGNVKVMLGVDRLDMIKGIPQKLLAFEKFLDENPEYRSSVVLVQIAVPSRLDVPEYQHLRSQVHEIVGRINGAILQRLSGAARRRLL